MTARSKARGKAVRDEQFWTLRATLAPAALGSLVLVSAFAVIYASHACRQLYADLQELESTRWHLQEEYGRLLLEQSAWASHYRVDKVARGELGMAAPALEELRVVSQ